MGSQKYQGSNPSRSRRRFGYLTDIVQFVNPFGESSARQAEANATSALKPHQKIVTIDTIMKRAHTPSDRVPSA